MSERKSTCSSDRLWGTFTGPTSANGTRTNCAWPPGYPPYMCEYPKSADPEYPYSFSSIQAFGFELSQSDQSPSLQKKHWPHAIVKGTTTRSPIFSRLVS